MSRPARFRRWSRWRHAPKLTGVLAGLSLVGQVVAEALGNGLFGNLGWAPPLVLTIASVGLQILANRRETPEPPAQPPGRSNEPLPPPADLLGRDQAVRTATDLLAAHRVVLVHGPSGMGVSAVAVEAARRMVPDQDLQDYVDLRGQNPRRPDGDRQVAARVLSTLGLEPGPGPAEAADRVREHLRDSGRVLVLDNVTRAEQIGWLVHHHVPGAYLVVAGDFVADDVGVGSDVAVGPLDPRSALELLVRQDTGEHLECPVADRISADPRRSQELAEKYLRNARIAIGVGKLLARNPGISIAHLLDDARREGTLARYIWSELLAGVSDEARTLIATLARVPVAEMPDSAVAAMVGRNADRVGLLLQELDRRGLVERPRPNRYRVAAEVRSLAELDRHASARGVARLARYYARQAADHAAALASGTQPELAEAAREWFGEDDAALVQLLAMPDPPRRVASDLWTIADALEVWFAASNRTDDRREVAEAMARAARALGDRAALRTAYLRLIAIHRASGDVAGANRSLVAVQRLGRAERRRGGSVFHTNRGLFLLTCGRLDQALQEFQLSAARRPKADGVGQVTDLVNMATVLLAQGRPNAAYAQLNEALAVAERVGDQVGQAHARELLGVVALRHRDTDQALELWAEAEERYEQCGVDVGRARCLAHTASLLLDRAADDCDAAAQAAAMLRRSLRLRRGQNTGLGVALAHLRLAQYAQRWGPADDVRTHRQAGLAALRGWETWMEEPSEITALREELTALPAEPPMASDR